MQVISMSKLNQTEELDFHYLLNLMLPLHDVKEFCWLPELFSTIGHENFIKLCKYAGGETIRIPTLYQLSDAIDALQYYYDVFIKQAYPIELVPVKFKDLVLKIKEVYDAEES